MIYCVSDIHGCYDKFMKLLEKINFNDNDTLYVLGDIVDRGTQNLQCLDFARSKENIICLLGNHEDLMLDFFERQDINWLYNGGDITLEEMRQAGIVTDDGGKMQKTEALTEILDWVRALPVYKEVEAGGRQYFLSHAGLNLKRFIPKNKTVVEAQAKKDFVWSRKEFIMFPGLPDKIHVFGHTPTPNVRQYVGEDTNDFMVWVDEKHNNDKICIDCAAVFGGPLAALRLDDGEIFYAFDEEPCN